MVRYMIPFVALVAGACGVSDSVLLSDLSDSQIDSLCNEFADFESVSFECDGFSFESEPLAVDECVDTFTPYPEGCEATVGDLRDCQDSIFEASEEEACDPEAEVDPGCEALAAEGCI